MNNVIQLIRGTLLFLFGQVLVWYQINGQFLSEWIKDRTTHHVAHRVSNITGLYLCDEGSR
jgi:hypothetical protein